MPQWHFSKPRIPLRAVAISAAALVVPFLDTTFSLTGAEPASALLWLLALVPAFLLAYYRGWQGVATALAFGMAALSVSVSVVLLRGASWPDSLLLPVIAAYIATALGAGWLSEALHVRRASAEVLALTDDLTGLPNRRRARTFLDEQLARKRGSRPISVVLFDLDNFKAFNDQHGHPAGDVLLRMFADVLMETTTADALPARYGGEEFMVILPGVDERHAFEYAERVRVKLRLVQQKGMPVTASAGVACYSGQQPSGNELIVAADRALYYAKQQGRDRACVASMPMAASG